MEEIADKINEIAENWLKIALTPFFLSSFAEWYSDSVYRDLCSK